MPADKPESVTAELPGMGLPGQYVVRTVVPMFPLGDPRNRGGPAGLAGDYEVTFTFNRPGYPLQPEKSIVSGDQLEGDSHLGIPKEFWFNANVEGELFSFIGEPNSKNFLAKIVIKCSAKNIKDAHDRCFRALMPVLSNFALRWDVPLVLYQTDVKELRTGVLQITNRNPFSEVSIRGLFQIDLPADLRPYGAIYREAITTESAPYQFLCFFRLIESIRARRTRISRDASQRQPHSMPVEIYPRTEADAIEFLNWIFLVKPTSWDALTLESVLIPEAVGKTFPVIIDSELKPIRDGIAHALLQRAEELISMDDHLARSKLQTWLLPIKCIARAMLKNEFGDQLG